MHMFFPCRTSPDGNCLYNACSVALIGNESLSGCLRLLTSIELYQNSTFYATHPYIQGKFDSGELSPTFKSINNAMSTCLGDASSWVFSKGDSWSKSILVQAQENCTFAVWSPLISLMALSYVIGRNIKSVFPDCNQRGLKNLFTGQINPRVKDGKSKCDEIVILWYDLGLKKKGHYIRELQETNAMDIESATVKVEGAEARKRHKDTLVDSSDEVTQAPVLKQAVKREPKENTESNNVTGVIKRGNPVFPLSEVNIRDIGLVYDKVKSLGDKEKYGLAVDVWRPDLNYEFHVTSEAGQRKRFVFQWLKRFPWLANSKYLDGAFCLPCVLFGKETGHNANKLDKLVKSPLRYWLSAHSKYKDHEMKSQLHHQATLEMDDFKKLVERKLKPIDEILDTVRSARIKKNREKIEPILETVIFCGRQNIALRGHRDDSAHRESEGNSNTRNFQELLDFRAKSGDEILKQHFETAPRNANYRSKTIQNEMIHCCGAYISNSLVQEIREAKIFAVLADEASDVSNRKQIALIIRFVDRQHMIREEFLRFIHCEAGTSGKAISGQIKEEIWV
eukprot:Seg5447.2 transcript_id=Seg5447.2/GoldUCD/mRNA.D3Y31 product="52 kDa repressor of the inhibitor of the protein kinase" protein_id=Seg5447.2/GoldUCD/D3Y31